MKNFILLLALTLGFAACEKDEDKIYLSSLEAGELVATESNVVRVMVRLWNIKKVYSWDTGGLRKRKLNPCSLSGMDSAILHLIMEKLHLIKKL